MENDFSKIINFSGFDENNPLKRCGDLNFWVDSKAYNFVENIHQFWLLSIVDLIIGKSEYPVNRLIDNSISSFLLIEYDKNNT